MSNILNQDSFFEQAATISKAHAYDIISQRAKELEIENKVLKTQVKHLRDLITYYTDEMLKTLK